MDWFEQLTGFAEESPQQVRANLKLEGQYLYSQVNGARFQYGILETPSLGELRAAVAALNAAKAANRLRQVVADVQALHADRGNRNALFQVASQFNLLEMVSPEVTPEQGVARYSSDRTQGPACAVAAGAGTIYRNYFVDVEGHCGQSELHQLDCLAEFGSVLGKGRSPWQMRNGYVMASAAALEQIDSDLEQMSEQQRDDLRARLRVGVQWQTEVTLTGAGHCVSQLYGSALPVAYNDSPAEKWQALSRLLLEASYEATVCAALVNAARYGCDKLFLTFLGGGVFGNATAWIHDAIAYALKKYPDCGLDIALVSYGKRDAAVERLLAEFDGQGIAKVKDHD